MFCMLCMFECTCNDKENSMKMEFNPTGCVIAVDIDGTLCEEGPSNFLNYAGLKPIKENIQKLNKLHEKNMIFLYTARFEEDREATEKWLKKHGVKYFKLIMEKIRAKYYIDNNALRMDEI